MKFVKILITNEIFWSAISALATIFIGWIAYRISKKQYKLEELKKEDFKFSHRLDLFTSISINIENFLSHNNPIHIGLLNYNSKQDEALDRALEILEEHARLRVRAQILFNDKEIEEYLLEIQNKMASTLDCVAVTLGKRKQWEILIGKKIVDTDNEIKLFLHANCLAGIKILYEKNMNNKFKKYFEI